MAAASAEPRFEVAENSPAGRFELLGDGELLSYAEIVIDGDNVVVPHVETIRAHRGNGHAARLLDAMLEVLRTEGRTVTPLCSFAAAHITSNPRHRELLAK